MPLVQPPDPPRPDVDVNPLFSREPVRIPRDRLSDGELDPETAYQVVHDELMLDGNPRLNLATFVTTWMPPQAQRLMAESADKNVVDKDEYHTFLRLGFDGYRRTHQYCREVASSLADRIAALGAFRLLTDGRQLPVFAFTLADGETGYSVFDVSAALRERGWLVPAYTFPADREDLAVLRIVVRNGFSHDLADLLMESLERALPRLRAQDRPQRGSEAASFTHIH